MRITIRGANGGAGSNIPVLAVEKVLKMSKSQQMLEFIESNLAKGLTIHVCTPLHTTAISPKTVARFKKANAQLFKIDADGFLRMAAGNKFNVICGPHVALVTVKAVNN